MHPIRALLMTGAALAFAGFLACNNGDGGGSGSTPSNPEVPTTTTTTTLSSPGACDPTPPPLYRIIIDIQDTQSSGGAEASLPAPPAAHTRILHATPHVPNTDGYCDRVGFGSYKECPVRRDGDPQKTACEGLVLGQATDTGRWGPTWKYSLEYEPAHYCMGSDPGCTNHPSDQFLLIAKGAGQFFAIASPTVPLSTDPNYPGSRQTRCWINSESDYSCD
jgi:hypothetical protein